MIYELYINGVQADLNGNTSIPLTWQYIDITNVFKYSDTFSKTITLPLTTKNKEIFGLINRIDRASSLVNQGLGVQFAPQKTNSFILYAYGTELLSGTITVDDIKEKEISIILSGVLSLISKALDEVTVGDLFANQSPNFLFNPFREGLNSSVVIWNDTYKLSEANPILSQGIGSYDDLANTYATYTHKWETTYGQPPMTWYPFQKQIPLVLVSDFIKAVINKIQASIIQKEDDPITVEYDTWGAPNTTGILLNQPSSYDYKQQNYRGVNSLSIYHMSVGGYYVPSKYISLYAPFTARGVISQVTPIVSDETIYKKNPPQGTMTFYVAYNDGTNDRTEVNLSTFLNSSYTFYKADGKKSITLVGVILNITNEVPQMIQNASVTYQFLTRSYAGFDFLSINKIAGQGVNAKELFFNYFKMARFNISRKGNTIQIKKPKNYFNNAAIENIPFEMDDFYYPAAKYKRVFFKTKQTDSSFKEQSDAIDADIPWASKIVEVGANGADLTYNVPIEIPIVGYTSVFNTQPQNVNLLQESKLLIQSKDNKAKYTAGSMVDVSYVSNERIIFCVGDDNCYDNNYNNSIPGYDAYNRYVFSEPNIYFDRELKTRIQQNGTIYSLYWQNFISTMFNGSAKIIKGRAVINPFIWFKLQQGTPVFFYYESNLLFLNKVSDYDLNIWQKGTSVECFLVNKITDLV